MSIPHYEEGLVWCKGHDTWFTMEECFKASNGRLLCPECRYPVRTKAKCKTRSTRIQTALKAY